MQFDDILIMKTNIVTTDSEYITNVSTIFHDNRTLMTVSEMGNLHRLTKRIMRLEGDIAEVGVYQGGSAKLLAVASNQQKPIHLFDTFDGIPEMTKDLDRVNLGDFSGSLNSVQAYLSAFKNIRYYPGIFPASITEYPEIAEKKFALVNLDVDTYVSTLKCLEFFYPRLVSGAALVVHDYNSLTCPGVKKAVDEFFTDKSETIVDLWATQALICKA